MNFYIWENKCKIKDENKDMDVNLLTKIVSIVRYKEEYWSENNLINFYIRENKCKIKDENKDMDDT